jgi:hypothetical protein
MIIMISLSIGFFIGYLTATLVNVARDYEMPKIEQEDLVRDHASETEKGWAKEVRSGWSASNTADARRAALHIVRPT